ncbi:MAG: hypothetical protein LBU27_06885 [Candidatus Peribacteria bacterium]|jgi:hypothetical protein|nr:hypothetical protein [Candidatus Peribacteria bacterium]
MQEENVTIITTADGQQIGLREEDREQLGINVRTNLATYCQRTSEPQAPYIVKEMHQLILDNLMMVFAGKIKKLIIQCPPRL